MFLAASKTLAVICGVLLALPANWCCMISLPAICPNPLATQQCCRCHPTGGTCGVPLCPDKSNGKPCSQHCRCFGEKVVLAEDDQINVKDMSFTCIIVDTVIALASAVPGSLTARAEDRLFDWPAVPLNVVQCRWSC
jgi:hypothetical protein